jgi:hypothetical protein
MTEFQEISKSLLERNDERQSLSEVWRRTWKGELVASLKASSDNLTELDAKYQARIAARLSNPDAPCGEEEHLLVMCSKTVAEMLDKVRGRMFELALHPTRPRAEGVNNGGGRGRKRQSLDIQVINPDAAGAVPSPDPAPKPDAH